LEYSCFRQAYIFFPKEEGSFEVASWVGVDFLFISLLGYVAYKMVFGCFLILHLKVKRLFTKDEDSSQMILSSFSDYY
jgi:hypothetical protein